jgi:hypothetical protein
VTTTDDLRLNDVRAVFDGENEADISMLRFLLPDVHEAECRLTRAAMHDYVSRNLQPRRQRRLETHLYGCDECIHAFIDIREVSWTRRAAGLAALDGTNDGAQRLTGPS